MTKEIAPYGTWKSPITPETLTERTVILSQLRIDGPDVYWVEDNPRRQGRSVLLRRDALQQTREVLPLLDGQRLVNVATHVHERGGRAYAVKDGNLVLTDGNDGRVYSFRVADRHRELVPLTPLSGKFYGDFELDLDRGLAYAVCEDRPEGGDKRDAVNTMVAIPLDGSAARDESKIRTIFSGTDFVTSPTLSPDGTKLAWLTWQHPEMAWTESELHVGALDEVGNIVSDVVLVDSPDVCAYEPRWTLDGDLMHVDDSTGWANFYRTEGFRTREGEPADAWETRLRTRALHPSDKAFSRPHWQLGLHSYDNLDHEHLVCSWAQGNTWKIGSIRLDNGLLEEWDVGWEPGGNIGAAQDRVVFLGISETDPPAIVEVVDAQAHVVRPSSEAVISEEYASQPEYVTWDNRDGSESYGLFYPPKSEDYEGEPGTLPPLLVTTHRVPTMSTRSGMDAHVQYWTSRGFAVFKPNPRGSTGNGREYREALNGGWGTIDAHDIEDGVKFLVSRGSVDASRVALRGEAFGAFTALSSLENSRVFSAGVLISGITNVQEYMDSANKFESYYPQRLLGVDEVSPEAMSHRCPLMHLERIEAPLLMLHGTDDQLASINRVRATYRELMELGKPVALKELSGEAHIFAHDHSIHEALRCELGFYGEVWDLKVDGGEKVKIHNFGS